MEAGEDTFSYLLFVLGVLIDKKNHFIWRWGLSNPIYSLNFARALDAATSLSSSSFQLSSMFNYRIPTCGNSVFDDIVGFSFPAAAYGTKSNFLSQLEADNVFGGHDAFW